MIWNEDGSNWDDTDMGTWSDTAQENNSSWSSAAGWKKDKNKNIKVVNTYMLLNHFHTSKNVCFSKNQYSLILMCPFFLAGFVYQDAKWIPSTNSDEEQDASTTHGNGVWGKYKLQKEAFKERMTKISLFMFTIKLMQVILNVSFYLQKTEAQNALINNNMSMQGAMGK